MVHFAWTHKEAFMRDGKLIATGKMIDSPYCSLAKNQGNPHNQPMTKDASLVTCKECLLVAKRVGWN